MVFQPPTAAFAASRLPPALPRGVARTWVAALLAIAALLLPGCDNPACVFGPGNCSGGGGIGLGENPATLPVDGTWIEVASPTITAVFPGSSAAADVHAPIVIFFSESMAPRNVGTTPPSGLGSVFELQSQLGAMVPLPGAFLVGDGRVLVLFPPAVLQADATYSIVMTEMSKLSDLTGQSLQRPANGQVGTFTTAALPAAAPRVLATWPRDATRNQSATTEIVVVFDRKIDVATVTDTSFDVQVDGSPPAFDPVPTPLSLGGPLTDTRVFRWRSLNAQGIPADLGQNLTVDVALSPSGNPIEDEDGNVLAATSFDFDTAPFSAPVSVSITSTPTDAIGIDQISGPANLAIESLLVGAQSGDFLVLTLFGTNPTVPIAPPLVALRREVALSAPFDSFTMVASEVDLLLSSAPLRARLSDGSLAMAFQVRRGNATSPVRLLDVDPATPGVQHPLLDTVAPVLLGLSTSGNVATTYRSDLRDVVLVGRASEPVARATVTTGLGDNTTTPGVAPPVVGSDASGLFVAAPVRLGVLSAADLPLDFGLTIYDRALNAATASSDIMDPDDGFRQLGQSGPAAALPGGMIDVEVYDSTTFAPVAAANVYAVENRNGSVIAVAGGFGTTDSRGRVTVPGAVSGATIVTVEKAGYDLFTFDAVPTGRLGVPLSMSMPAPATASGTVGPADQIASTQLNLYTRAVVDSRRRERDAPFSAVSTCSLDPGDDRFECPFGPITVQTGRLGAQSAITVLPPPNPFLYTALTFLKTAEVHLPLAPVEAGADQETHLALGTLLDAATLDPEERPLDTPIQLASTANWPGLPTAPTVVVEATSPGIPGAVAVGRGIAFNDALPPDTWTVRAAYPGAADGIQDAPDDALGRLVTAGTLDPDLLLRFEVADAAGNQGGARPRLSVASGALAVPAAPVLPMNPATPNAGGMSFDLGFPDVLPDVLSPPGRGLYRIELTDTAGRRWILYRPDRSDVQGPNVIVHVPNLAGVFPLAPGALSCRISAWSWPTLDLSNFLWSDVDREHDLFVHAVAQNFTPP